MVVLIPVENLETGEIEHVNSKDVERLAYLRTLQEEARLAVSEAAKVPQDQDDQPAMEE